MNEETLSVRIPDELYAELQQFAREGSYLSTSDAVRSILRRKTSEKLKGREKSKQELISQVERLLERLKDAE